jgi:lipopolysaccharide export system permease protein
MLIIDRYLLRRYVQNFLICFLSLMGLFVVIDAFTNLEEFLRCGSKCGGVVPFIARHYAFKSLWFFDMLAGLLAMAAAMFTISWIQRHNEMTALMAAGVPRIRVLRPILIAASTVVLLAAVNRELVIPRCRDELLRKPQDLIGDQPQSFGERRDNQTDVRLSGTNSYADQKRITNPEFTLPPVLRTYGKQVLAENAYYREAEGKWPAGYLLDSVREPQNLDARPSLPPDGPPVLITPRDAPWLRPNQCFLVSNLTFEQLTSSSESRELSSIAEMIANLRNPSLDYVAKDRVAIHARIVQPLLDITLLFLGLPLIIARENRNMFIAMGLCMLVTSVFILVVLGAHRLGEYSMPPFDPALAAWFPLVVFVPVAVGLAEWLWK